MIDLFLAVLAVSLMAGIIAVVLDLFVEDTWEFFDAVVPVLIFPVLMATIVTGVWWLVSRIVLG